MDEEKYQKELFEFEKPKRRFPRLSDFFPKADFERNVILTLTLDRAVFIAIGIIMIMVAVYALGVESGKSRSPQKAQLPVMAPQTTVAAAPVITAATAQLRPANSVKAQSVAMSTVVTNSIKKPPAAAFVNKPYIIVAATFSQRDNAITEAQKLRAQGFDAAVLPSGRYFQACVGAYADKNGADSRKDLKKIKRSYKDAYIRLR